METGIENTTCDTEGFKDITPIAEKETHTVVSDTIPTFHIFFISLVKFFCNFRKTAFNGLVLFAAYLEISRVEIN